MISGLKIIKMLPNGDCGILMRFQSDANLLVGIHALANDLLANPPSGIYSKTASTQKALAQIVNIIPATDSLVVVFASPIDLKSEVLDVFKARCENLVVNHRYKQVHDIPVCYAADVASDVQVVCERLGLSHQQLIDFHSEPIYHIDMLGFLPGFAYLSGNNSILNLPRKNTPKLQVEAGSVAIANQHTGIYSLSSPGGWHVIGRTPKQLLNWTDQQHPMVLNPLDEVRFRPIDLQEFKLLCENHAN